jgi:DNA-binding MarR family transcriptional regulator
MYSTTYMPSKKKAAPNAASASWTFLTNHSHVLLCLAADDSLRVRDLAEKVGITERAVLKILSELEAGGAIEREREGRRNRYRVQHLTKLRHTIEEHCTIGDLVAVVHGGRRKAR